jgi:hypothetical protein
MGNLGLQGLGSPQFGLHRVSLPLTFVEFFPQSLNFLFLGFKRGEVGDDALVEVFNCFQKG